MTNEVILLVEDDDLFRRGAAMYLEDRGYTVLEAACAEDALERLAAEDVDLVVTDLHMPGIGGITLLERVRARAPELKCIIVSGRGRLEDAVAALRLGAYDYLLKPLETMELLEVAVRRALDARRLERANQRLTVANRALQSDLSRRQRLEHVVGQSASVREAIDLALKVACSDVTVLIEGESGTGKEWLARGIHAASARADAPFVAINCGALPGELLESELFGARRGAYTGASADRPGLFQAAHGGTLLLDEVGDMPPAMQVKLLRALQERSVRPIGATRDEPVDVRVIGATHRILADEVAAGRFREDLFYRLSVFPITVPPLRERRDDLPRLVAHLLARIADRHGKSIRGLTPAALDALARYPFPGNVRELENELERASVLAEPDTWIDEALLSPRLRAAAGRERRPAPGHEHDLLAARDRFELDFIEDVLGALGGNVSQAATRMGLTRMGLVRKLKGLRAREAVRDGTSGADPRAAHAATDVPPVDHATTKPEDGAS